MKLIIGGAYQGKSEYAVATYGGKVFSCSEGQIDWTANIITDLQEFSRRCLEEGKEAALELEKAKDLWQTKVLIGNDISQGIVPMDPVERGWREMNGRMMIYLAKEAESVERVFCGIPQKLK